MVEGLSDSLVGKKVTLQTSSGETHEGVIYGYDQGQNCLALFDAHPTRSGGRQSVKMFNLSHISSVTSSGDEELPDHFKPKAELPKINTDKLKERAAIEKEKRRAAMGDNVSIEAQDVFDAISRTLTNCRWEKHTIVVMDIVSLSEPYGTDNLQISDPQRESVAQATLNQVKKILENRKR